MLRGGGIAELRDWGRRLLAATRSRPYFALAGVLLGSMISNLSNRITSFGLADVRGAVHAGFDEGAWITTAFTVGQMVMVLPAVFLGAIFGPRRVLLAACAVYAVAAFLLPFSAKLAHVLFWQVICGLSSGPFVPLTLAVILRKLTWRTIPFGCAIYALNTELSLNISASLEGWFTDHWSWRWIFWDSALLAPAMLLCLWLGMEREPINDRLLRNTTWSGILFASAGFGMLYAALDQGNRLDWFNSGLIVGLVVSGVFLIASFFLHEALVPNPAINLHFVTRGNLPLLALLLILFRFVILSTGYIIPQYTTVVQDFRGLDTGAILIWVALPQLLLAPIAGTSLLRVDARVTLAVGFALVGLACYMQSDLTGDWASGDFMTSQVVQAVGQSLTFTSLVYFAVLHLDLTQAMSFGALLQTARLFGGELGNGLMQTFVRVREQVHSNLTGLHVMSGSFLTDTRIQELSGAVLPKSLGPDEASARATALLHHTVQIQSAVLSYIDGFTLVTWVAAFALLIMVFLRTPPASPFAPPSRQ